VFDWLYVCSSCRGLRAIRLGSMLVYKTRVNAKRFYLLLYWIPLRTLSLSLFRNGWHFHYRCLIYRLFCFVMKTVFQCVSKIILYICKHCVITNTLSLIHFPTLVKMWFLCAKQTCEQSAIHTFANIGSSEQRIILSMFVNTTITKTQSYLIQ